jgi:peroxiredoxin
MQEAQSSPVRGHTWWSLAVLAALALGWIGVKASIRSHVRTLVQGCVGRRLPAFSLRDGAGRTWDNGALVGHVVVLHFIRADCPACDAEAEDFRRFEAVLPSTALLLHVATDQLLGIAPADTTASLRRKAFRCPVLMADAAFLNALHEAQWSGVTPITYVVDAKGVIRAALQGRQTVESLRAALRAAG